MALAFNREPLADGICFTSITDSRFKTNYITVNFFTELKDETVSLNAVIPNVLTRSNSDYPSLTEIKKKLTELYGAYLNGSVGKFGDTQCVTLAASCIADVYTLNNEKITEEMTELLLNCIMKPHVVGNAFYEKNFLLNKQELLDDIDAEINEKRSYAMIRSGKTIYSGEPAAISRNGEKKYAEAMTAESAYEHYKNLLKTAQIEILFVGGGNPDDAREKFRSAFSEAERSFNGKYTSEKSPIKSETADVTETLDVAQSKMVMAFKTECTDVPAMKMMNAIFGQTPFSKLFVNVREKLSLCYYCAAGFEERKGVLYVDSGVEQDNIAKAREEILNQLSEVAKGNFTDEEMQNSALSLINSHVSVNDSPGSLASWYLRQAYNGTEFSPEDEIERLKAVTREDIIHAAQTLKLDTVYVLTGKGE